MSDKPEVWVIDDDRSIRWVLEKALVQEGLTVTSFASGEHIMEKLASAVPSALVSDIRMPRMDGLRLLEHIGARYPELPIIIMTAYSDLETAVSAYQLGAFEYLPKPFDVDEAVSLVRRAVRFGGERRAHNVSTSEPPARDIVGSCHAMQGVFRAIGRLSRSHVTVLITGESGTGKELVARALHRHSPRSDKPFIALNMAAIPRDLLESELFGHEKGAFTGAHSRRQGRFEQADGGTLFLDEIGDMPPELQTRLLRVLANGEFYRIGGHAPIGVDVRVIAATHRNLAQRVDEGLFREDLFHRINVISVHAPALRERRADISLLTRYFLDLVAEELGVMPKTMQPDTEAYLMQLDWPGNVRQLENTCRWLTVMASGNAIHVEDLPPELRQETGGAIAQDAWETVFRRWVEKRLASGERDLLNAALPSFERIMIEAALKYTGGRRQDAAKLLGWGRNTLARKIKEHSISVAR